MCTGPCEALLTTANLLIVLGLRDAIRNTPPDGTTTTGGGSSSRSSDTAETSVDNQLRIMHSTTERAGEGEISGRAADEQQQQQVHPARDAHSTSLAVEGPKFNVFHPNHHHHQLPGLQQVQQQNKAPGVMRAQAAARSIIHRQHLTIRSQGCCGGVARAMMALSGGK